MPHPITKRHHHTQSPTELLPKPKSVISKKGKKTVQTNLLKNIKHILKVNFLHRYDLNCLLQEEKKAYQKALKAEEQEVTYIDLIETKISLLAARLPACKKEARSKENFFFLQRAKGRILHLHQLLKDHKNKLEELNDDIEGIEESIENKKLDLIDEARKILSVKKGVKKIIPLPQLFAIYQKVSKILKS